jgi:hypothetical protein
LARLIGLTLRKRPRSQAQVSPTSDLRAAKQLRDELKQQFRVALKSGRLTCQAEIRAAIEELLPAWSLQQRKDLLLHMKISDPKPSHAAAYLSAAKFGLPVRQVRAGRAPKAQRQRLPSRMEAWTDQTERDLVKRKMRRR